MPSTLDVDLAMHLSGVSFINRAIRLQQQQYVLLLLRLNPLILAMHGRYDIKHRKFSDPEERMAAQDVLASLIATHYEELVIVAPATASLAITAENPRTDRIILPSLYSSTACTTLGLNALASVELELRIGAAHDTLEVIRTNIGVASFLTEASKSNLSNRQGATTTKTITSIDRANALAKKHLAIYERGWRALEVLGGVGGKDHGGLQRLEQMDLTNLSEWFSERKYKETGAAARLPWIWMASRPREEMDTDSDVAKAVREWQSEGTSAC